MALCKLLLIALLFSFNSFGQYPMTKLLQKKASSCALLLDTYTGASAAYSLRLLDCDYAGNCIRVRRSSDNTEQNISFSGGVVDTASMKTFVGTGGTDDGFVVTWYDQSGNGRDATQATAGSQPKIMDNGVIYRQGSTPTIQFSSSSLGMTNIAPGANYSVFSVGKRDASGGNYTLYGTTTGTATVLILALLSDNKYYFQRTAGYLISTSTDATTSKILLTSIAATGSQDIYKNGSSVATSYTALAIANEISMIGAYTSGAPYYLAGNLQELIFYSSDKSSDRVGIETNLNSFYTIF